MAVKTILVALGADAASNARLGAACGLARAHDAHLTALALELQPDMPVAAAPGVAMAAMDWSMIDDARGRAQSMAEAAAKTIEAEGLSPDARGVCAAGPGLEDAVAIAARHADLTVIGTQAEGSAGVIQDAALDGALFESGRPVLLLPPGVSEVGSRRILIAWDGSRVAARALSDAAPFLAMAENATIAVVDAEPGAGPWGEDPGADISKTVARHGVATELARLSSDGAGAAAALIRHARESGCDMIVMGGYGHARIREIIFSGATREMLSGCPIPVLMSH